MKTRTTIPIGPVTTIGALIILVAVAAVWVGPGLVNTPTYPSPIQTPPAVDPHTLVGKPLPTFASEADIIAQFKAAQALGSGGGLFGRDMVLNVMAPTASADGMAGGAKSESSGPSYSTTNNQVAGVDEADIVKTDGKYVYAFYKNTVKIIEAYPAEDAEVVATIPLGDVYPQNMFINGDHLIVFGTQSQYGGDYPMPYTKMMAGGYYPYYGYSLSVVRVYDLSTIKTPDLVKEYAFRGNNVSSRMIGNDVYFVVTTYPEYHILSGETEGTDVSIIPPYYEDGVERVLALPTDIGYIPPVYAQTFITIASIDLDSLSLEKETMVGNAETVYASEDNLYVAHTQYYDPVDWPQIIERSVNTIIAPQPYIQPQVKTVISKFALKDGMITFAGQGKVAGRLLNQFSMDEWEDHFRIATTTDEVWGNEWNPTGTNQPTQEQANHVYVLDADMDVVGSLEDLAPGEQIYSARFMGERAYLVTFKQVDPLFVLDLSSHEFPQVLGKLKIPGYSNYLHPLDDTHILGIGKDAEVSKNDNAYYLGMKLAIFDVTDVENPIQSHSLIVGDRGTDSYALQDHKAFLYDKEKGLLVLPIYLHEVDDSQLDKPNWQDWPAYGVPVFQGAFAWKVSLEDGFEEIGKVTHIDKEIDLKAGYYYDYSYQVKRSLLIGDVLYTLSDKRLMANDLLDDLKEIATVDFVNVPKTFTVKSKVEGVFCAGPCGYHSVEISKDKIKTENYSGGEGGYLNISEYPAYEQYENLFELLDWKAFKELDDVLGCPGCADGQVETITISDGSKTHTVKMEAGMEVKSIQPFLNSLRSYTGLGGIYYPSEPIPVDIGGGIGDTPVVGETAPAVEE
jgi:uncharacterized secreted protein with C-terminal beta-propeller domain